MMLIAKNYNKSENKEKALSVSITQELLKLNISKKLKTSHSHINSINKVAKSIDKISVFLLNYKKQNHTSDTHHINIVKISTSQETLKASSLLT